ncbi:MAG: hypothetical protein JXB45_11105 [Candidatus Krumholzibacteriota bacterium]|nr:hypothetical protein [Candidatus Krumholzibacteriota bacterium]
MLRRFPVFSLALFLFVFSLTGCAPENPVDNSSPASRAPQLPPATTMSIDLSLFKSASVDAEAIAAGDLERSLLTATQGSKLNFLNAAVRVLFLDVVVYSALVEPVAAFAVAAHSVPQPQPDGSWLWTYIFVSERAEYSIFLHGREMDDHVAWKLEVFSTAEEMTLDHFLWFEGQTRRYQDSGYWQFYEPAIITAPAGRAGESATQGIKTVRIDWINRSRREHELEIRVNKPGDPEEGTTLSFLETPGLCSIDFFDAKEQTNGNITWYGDDSGSIEWPDYNGGVKSCWDSRQNNVTCP